MFGASRKKKSRKLQIISEHRNRGNGPQCHAIELYRDYDYDTVTPDS